MRAAIIDLCCFVDKLKLYYVVFRIRSNSQSIAVLSRPRSIPEQSDNGVSHHSAIGRSFHPAHGIQGELAVAYAVVYAVAFILLTKG